MLFILGTKSYHLKNGQIENFTCPKCSKQTSLDCSIYRRYTYVTFIPIFPVDKQLYTACSSCSEEIELHELSDDIQSKIEILIKDSAVKTPFWMYSGIVILIGFAIFGLYSFFKTDEISKTYLMNLRKDDVLNVKLSNGYYSTIRIDKVTKDSVFGTSNDYRVDLPYERDEIDTPENYTNSKMYYSKKDVVSLYEKGEISSIKRE